VAAERFQGPILLTASREELLEHCIKLYQENQKLKEDIERLKEQLKIPPKIRKEQEKKQSRSRPLPPERWGRKPGHPGITRPKPLSIDREVQQTLKACPDCRGRLSEPQEVTEHIQEDIIPAQVMVSRYLRYRYWCRGCKKIVSAPYAPDEVPCGYLGPMALITMAILKYHHGLPGNKIREVFRDLAGLKVSEGAIAQALQRLSYWLKVEVGVVAEALRRSPFVHLDETGWKVNGANHWLWAMVNERLAYYEIHPSRGSKIARALLGDNFKGTLISDFYSAYNKLGSRQQKCLVHLLREMRQLRQRDPTQDFLLPYRKLKRIIQDALRLNERRQNLGPIVFNRRKELLNERLISFGCSVQSHKDWKRLSARILKHHKSILAFLDVPGLPSNNNAAERSIRGHVIIRNRSYQNRTQKGAEAHSTLTSLIRSLELQEKNPLGELAHAYLRHRQGNQEPILFAKA